MANQISKLVAKEIKIRTKEILATGKNLSA